MNTPQNLTALFGLKWNPFLSDLPSEALYVRPPIEHFARRLESKITEGGFALLCGSPGTGKSVALRILADKLAALRDVTVGVLAHPRSRVFDFYRELGELFRVPLRPHNRWGSFKALRETWQTHIQSTLYRPVLLIDEAQDLHDNVLNELKVLTSTHFDSRSLLTVVLCGDNRLLERFSTPDLKALGTRLRPRLALDSASPKDLADFLRFAIENAGNPRLMTHELLLTLAEHSAGNYRVLCGMAADLLAAAADKELSQLDEKLFLEIFAPPIQTGSKKPSRPDPFR